MSRRCGERDRGKAGNDNHHYPQADEIKADCMGPHPLPFLHRMVPCLLSLIEDQSTVPLDSKAMRTLRVSATDNGL